MLRLKRATKNGLRGIFRTRYEYILFFQDCMNRLIIVSVQKKPHLNASEDEEDEDDGDEDDDEDDDDDEDEDEEEEKLNFNPSDDEEMPEALDHLNDFVSNLDVTSTKRKATEDPSEVGASTDARAHKRRLVKERTEAGTENEFRARSSGIFFNYFVIIFHFIYLF